MGFFEGEKIWRVLANFWTVLFLAFIIFNFFYGGNFDFLLTPFSILYVGILSIYVGTKEFDRWYEIHSGKHPGEVFVIIWTILILGLMAVSFASGERYSVSKEIVADYIAVLSIFAVTQKSKKLYKSKRK